MRREYALRLAAAWTGERSRRCGDAPAVFDVRTSHAARDLRHGDRVMPRVAQPDAGRAQP